MHELSEASLACFEGIIAAQLAAAAGRRSIEEAVELSTYMRTAEFEARASRLEPLVHDVVAAGEPLPLPIIASQLELPTDIAVGWLRSIGVPLIVAIGNVRAAA